MLVEHERGFMRAFDEHLSAVSAGDAPLENVDYTVTWTAITGWEPWPPVIRLELKIDGLNARPRLLFRGETMLPLWLLADGAFFGLILHPRTKGWVSASSCMWILGPTPAARGLARILGDLGVPRPIMPAARRPSAPAAAPERVALAGVGANAREPRASRPALSRRTTKTSPKEKIMRDIATATLSGNLTRDVELKSLPSGTDVARLRVATTTRRRAGEEWVDKTNYFTVEVYGAQARSCAQYLHKGSRVFVDAELDWREWTDQQDNKREAVTFRARQVLFEGGRPTSAVTAADAGEQNGADPEPASSTDREPAGVGSPSEAGSASADDLPF